MVSTREYVHVFACVCLPVCVFLYVCICSYSQIYHVKGAGEVGGVWHTSMPFCRHALTLIQSYHIICRQLHPLLT